MGENELETDTGMEVWMALGRPLEAGGRQEKRGRQEQHGMRENLKNMSHAPVEWPSFQSNAGTRSPSQMPQQLRRRALYGLRK